MDPLPHPLVCDAPRLCQALEALLDNALGFTERGTLSLRLAAHSEGHAWRLRFEVEDQGPGLPPDWERLLHPFEQEERSLRRRRGGLGIGLPLAAGLIEVLGGRMGLEPLTTGTLAWVEIGLEEPAL
jgi:signal transduction histidine kinase